MAAKRQCGKLWTPSGLQYDDELYKYAPGERPPLASGPFDDEFADASIDAKWAWANQGSATIEELDGYTRIVMASVAGFNWRIRKQTCPSGDFTLRAKVGVGAKFVTAASRGGIMLIANGTSKMLTLYCLSTTAGFNVVFERWTNETTFSALIGSQLIGGAGNTAGVPVALYLQLGIVGTAVVPTISWDGVSWWDTGLSEDITTFLGANRAALDRIGFGGSDEGTGKAAWMTAHWFRVTTP